MPRLAGSGLVGCCWLLVIVAIVVVVDADIVDLDSADCCCLFAELCFCSHHWPRAADSSLLCWRRSLCVVVARRCSSLLAGFVARLLFRCFVVRCFVALSLALCLLVVFVFLSLFLFLPAVVVPRCSPLAQ